MATSLAVAKSGSIGVIGTFKGTFTAKDKLLNPTSDPIAFALALDPTGEPMWAKPLDTAGGTIDAIASSPSQDAFAICGKTPGTATAIVPKATTNADGSPDILVAKIDAATGAILWSRQIGGAGKQLCNAVAMNAAGDVFIAGGYNGTLDFGGGAFSPAPAASAFGIWVAKLDKATGDTLSSAHWANSESQQVTAAAVDDAGNLAIAGILKGTLVVGTSNLTVPVADDGSPNTDGFAIKLDASLNPVWARNWGDALDQDIRGLGFDSKGNVIVAGSLLGTIDLGNGTKLTAATGADSYGIAVEDAYWMKLLGDTGAPTCGANYGDDIMQKATRLVVARPTVPGPQSDVVTIAGYFNGMLDFGLGATSQLVAGVPGTGTASHTASFLFQMTP